MTRHVKSNKNIKLGSGFKCKLKKLFGMNTNSLYEDKMVDEINKLDVEGQASGLQLDAVPDNQSRKNQIFQVENGNDSNDDNLNYMPSDQEEINSTADDEKTAPVSDDENNTKTKHDSTSNEKMHSEESSNTKKITNIVVNGGSGIHIGPQHIFHTVNNVQYNNLREEKQKKRVKKTDAVRVLMQSKNPVKSGHCQFISQHLDAEWKDVGCFLGVAAADISFITQQYETVGERAYQMLTKWRQLKGDSATVGLLCKTLWKTGTPSAMKAVQELSLNISKVE